MQKITQMKQLQGRKGEMMKWWAGHIGAR